MIAAKADLPPSEGGGSVFFLRGRALCAPRYAGAPPCTRVTFPTRGKSPKARQGLRPLESPGAWLPPFSRSLTHRAGLPSATKIDRFATLRWWANRSFFLPELYLGSHLLLSIRGAAVSLWIACRPEFLPFLGGAARRAAGGMIMPPKGSTQRGYPSGRFFGDFLIGEKVTRVQGGAPASGCWDCRPAKAPGRRAERLHIGERGGATPRKKATRRSPPPAPAAGSRCAPGPPAESSRRWSTDSGMGATATAPSRPRRRSESGGSRF